MAGTIRGKRVLLHEGEFQGQLALFEEGSWASSPSLLIFLFLNDGETPDGRTFTAASQGGFSAGTPHVHYRWREGETIESAVAVNGYDMELIFGERSGGKLPGKIRFSVPGEETSVSGVFEVSVRD